MLPACDSQDSTERQGREGLFCKPEDPAGADQGNLKTQSVLSRVTGLEPTPKKPELEPWLLSSSPGDKPG